MEAAMTYRVTYGDGAHSCDFQTLLQAQHERNEERRCGGRAQVEAWQGDGWVAAPWLESTVEPEPAHCAECGDPLEPSEASRCKWCVAAESFDRLHGDDDSSFERAREDA